MGEEKPRAAMVILARDEDLDGVLLSMTRLEARFNNTKYRRAPCLAYIGLSLRPCHAMSLNFFELFNRLDW